MKILVITSRYTAQRDIIDEDFGRQTRIFSALHKLDHDIRMLCADYRKFESKSLELHGVGVDSIPFRVMWPFSFIMRVNAIIKKEKPDLIIGSGDPLWGVVGYFLSKRFKTAFLYDLHDNYEVYQSYSLPFFKYVDDFIMKKADIITTVSQTLKDKIKKIRPDAYVIQNGFDPKIFRPMDRDLCRKKLKLPRNAKIIAYAGRIGGKFEKNQSINILIDAFRIVRKKNPNTYLAVMGKKAYRGINLNHKNLIFLGSGEQKTVAELINAADIAVVPNPDDNFARYCFPYKIVEYMACKTPVVATNIGDIRLLLSKYNDALCRFDPDDLAEKIIKNMNKGRIEYKTGDFTWESIAKRLDNIIIHKI